MNTVLLIDDDFGLVAHALQVSGLCEISFFYRFSFSFLALHGINEI